ncbi:MAG: three-Cys-motif partner protein TcmP [Candidatus Korobacteraceae bacterium]
MSDSDNWYLGREQTFVKHHLLKDYLAALANIVGQEYSSVTYVDCFSGPWKAASQKYQDTSFGIAIEELKKARNQLRTQFNRNVSMRCFFIEKNERAYHELNEFLQIAREPGVELEAKNGRFEDLVPEIIEFVNQSPGTFPFFFIDPKGWRAISIGVIKSLLMTHPGEVLINLMTSHLHRFVKTQNQSELFGSAEYVERLRGLSGQDLDDEIVAIYSEKLRTVGCYEYVCAAVILRSNIDVPHYRLIYGTRHQLGLTKFKEAEKRAMNLMEPARSQAKLRKFEKRTGQSEMFGGNETLGSKFYVELRDRYVARSRSKVFEILSSKKRVPYDTLWKAALANPLVFESDLKGWLGSDPKISVSNLGNERVPKVGRNHIVSRSE